MSEPKTAQENLNELLYKVDVLEKQMKAVCTAIEELTTNVKSLEGTSKKLSRGVGQALSHTIRYGKK